MHEVTELMSMKRPTLARLNSAGDSATATHLGFD